jgi:hypothetical protein
MKSIAELVQAYQNIPKGKKCVHWKQDVVNTLIEVYGLNEKIKAKDQSERYKKTYGMWLGMIKRSRKEWPAMMELLEKADRLPEKYNKLGYIVNQLKAPKTLKLL